MTVGIQTACSFNRAATRLIAELASHPPISPTKNNVRASLGSASNTTYLLHPITEQATPTKPASLSERFFHFFQCKKLKSLHRFDFYGAPVDIDVTAIKRSLPGEELHIRFSKEIISLYQRTQAIERYCQSKLQTTGPENQRVLVAQDLESILHRLKNTQAEFERLKIALGKHHIYGIELNLLIDACTSFRKNLNTKFVAYIEKQRALSTEKIKQICSESGPIVERSEKLLKKINYKYYNEENHENQKKMLNEDTQRSRSAIENAQYIIRKNLTWYSEHEFMKLNTALTNIKEAARKLNLDELEKKLASAASSKIPRAKLKTTCSPTQSNC